MVASVVFVDTGDNENECSFNTTWPCINHSVVDLECAQDVTILIGSISKLKSMTTCIQQIMDFS
jgi:hypothetical protein